MNKILKNTLLMLALSLNTAMNYKMDILIPLPNGLIIPIKEELRLRDDIFNAVKNSNINLTEINQEVQEEVIQLGNSIYNIRKILNNAYIDSSSDSKEISRKVNLLNLASEILSSAIFNKTLFSIKEEEDASKLSEEKLRIQVKSQYQLNVYTALLESLNTACFEIQRKGRKEINSSVKEELSSTIDRTINISHKPLI